MFNNVITKFRTLHLSLWALLFLFGLLAANISQVSSQAYQNWSPRERVPGYTDETLPPYLVVDQNRTVHAFTSQWMGEDNPQLAVVYNQWTLEGGWSSVVDVILSPIEQARVLGAFLDVHGMIHLIFFGGDDVYANIYYTRAPAEEAGRATAWLEPQLIGWDAITPSAASLAGDEYGNLVVLYGGSLSGNGVYSILSSDSGNTWSEIIPIYLTNDDTLSPYGIHTYLGHLGWLHAVWTVSDQRGHNQAGHYSRLDTETWDWSDVIEFDQGIGIDQGMGIANPAVIEHKFEVFIMYNNGIPPSGVPPTQWYIKSNDFGKSWTPPVRPFTRHVGRNGLISFVVSSDDVLHVIFADRIPTTTSDGVYEAIGGIWQSMFRNGSWNEPETIAAMSREDFQAAQLRDPDFPLFSPYDARAIISQGNILLVTWRSDPGGDRNGVWYSFSTVDAPELPELALPTSSVINIQATVSTAISETRDNNEFFEFPKDKTPDSGNPQAIISISLLPVLLIIILVVFSQRRRNPKS